MTGWTARNKSASSDCIWLLHSNAQILWEVKHWTCQTMPDQYRSYSNALPFWCALGLGFIYSVYIYIFIYSVYIYIYIYYTHLFGPFLILFVCSCFPTVLCWAREPGPAWNARRCQNPLPSGAGPRPQRRPPKGITIVWYRCFLRPKTNRKTETWYNISKLFKQQNQEQIFRCSESTFPYSVLFNWASWWYSWLVNLSIKTSKGQTTISKVIALRNSRSRWRLESSKTCFFFKGLLVPEKAIFNCMDFSREIPVPHMEWQHWRLRWALVTNFVRNVREVHSSPPNSDRQLFAKLFHTSWQEFNGRASLRPNSQFQRTLQMCTRHTRKSHHTVKGHNITLKIIWPDVT